MLAGFFNEGLHEFAQDSLFSRARRVYECAYGPDVVRVFRNVDVARTELIADELPAELIGVATLEQIDAFCFDAFARFAADPARRAFLDSEQLLVLLHLDGTDEIGHLVSTDDPVYGRNLQRTDARLRALERSVRALYGDDGATAFVLTSDHAQSYSGDHGLDLPWLRRVLFLAWGAGIAEPQQQRADLAQVDICPLIAALLGTRIPDFSAGRVPLEYLRAPAEHQTAIARANLRQLAALVRALLERTEASREELERVAACARHADLKGDGELISSAISGAISEL